MSENILEKIISKKIKRVDEIKKTTKIEDLAKLIEQNKSYIDFKGKIKSNIQENKTSLIAEIKKASPSAGVIIDNY
ncbi:MAG: indole-3-glycerol-phosphate synthase, partial [Proteobacteria bacterium]